MDFEPMRKVLIGALGFVFLVNSAVAQQPQQTLKCGPHAEIVAILLAQFKEQLVGYGLNGGGKLTEFFASPQGTWTMLVTPPVGPSCITDSGEFWKMDDALPVAGRRGV
jgi:hypothetical protein